MNFSDLEHNELYIIEDITGRFVGQSKSLVAAFMAYSAMYVKGVRYQNGRRVVIYVDEASWLRKASREERKEFLLQTIV